MSVFNANLQITKSKVKNGEIVNLEINEQNIPLASSVKIEAEKEVTIDVSDYSEPIVITPTEGKDGIAKIIITLDNIPEAEGD